MTKIRPTSWIVVNEIEGAWTISFVFIKISDQNAVREADGRGILDRNIIEKKV